MNWTLTIFCFLSPLLWGTYIGGRLKKGYHSTKVHLPRKSAFLGSILFTLPTVSLLFFSSVSDAGAIVAIATAIAALIVGLMVGIKVYWID